MASPPANVALRTRPGIWYDIMTYAQRGFAVPVVVIALTILGVLVTGAFYSTRQEVQIGRADENASLAFYMTERGINGVLANWGSSGFGGLPVWGSAQVVDTSDLGFVTVDVTRAGAGLYYLDAVSELTARGEMTRPSYRIGTVVRREAAELEPRAALTTRNNLEIQGNAKVNGMDTDPVAWGALCAGGSKRDKAGLIIDDTTGFGSGGVGSVDGAPPVLEDPTLDDGDFSQFGDFDWEDMVALANKRLPGGAINTTGPIVDGNGDCAVGAPLNWGDPENPGQPCFNYFPVIHVMGDAVMQSGGVGQGVLLVEGDLDLRGGFVFYGLIMVKGNFETQGSGNRVLGSVMAANADIEDQTVTGGSMVTFSSCIIDRVLANLPGLVRARRLDRGWVDLSAIIY
jgi:hypothetical protein